MFRGEKLQAIEGGMPIEAMVDLTGGLAERYKVLSKLSFILSKR